MAQLTIYMDGETRKEIERAASQARSSVSRWVKEKLTNALRKEWPQNYFDVFGSLSEGDIHRPQQPNFKEDRPRQRLSR